MLNDFPIIAFIPTNDADAAHAFYEQILGLTFVSDDGFALVFRTGTGTVIRIARVGDFTPARFTILGWEVPDIAALAQTLTNRGVPIQRYSFLQLDDLGIWTAPTGDRILWFTDPDGNTLSLSQHV